MMKLKTKLIITEQIQFVMIAQKNKNKFSLDVP